MKKLIKCIFVVLTFILIIAFNSSGPVSGATHEEKSLEELRTHLKQCIPALINSYNITGVAITLDEDGETAWIKAYGFADLEESRMMTGDTYCREQVLRYYY